MSIMNHLAQAAAMLLLLELLVVVIIFAAISGGLAFGLRWVNGKTEWAFSKGNGYLAVGRRYLHTGTGYAAKPFILLNAGLARVEATVGSLRQQSLALQESKISSTGPGAVPISPNTPTEPLV